MKEYKIYVEDEARERVDSYIAKKFEKVSRTRINKLIKDGLILVNDKKIKPKYKVKKEDLIYVNLPKPKEIELKAENIPLDIIYEDSDILIINKAAGMVVHPAPGNESGTLVNALLYKTDDLSSENKDIRPGIVHRLDKDTSGLIVVARTDLAYELLTEQFKKRNVKRRYMALVYGRLEVKESTINAPIGRNPLNRKKMAVVEENSKEAITHYKVLKEFGSYSLIEASLQTGRTHQIRVHMSYINHPIVGDSKYSKMKNEFGLETQLLHASELGFIHPRSKKYLEFQAEVPKSFNRILNLLEKRNR